MRLVCDLAAPFVANSAVDRTPVWEPLRSHTEKCLRCQARHAAMTRAARELEGLREMKLATPVGLERRVMETLEGDLALSRGLRIPVAAVAGLVSLAVVLLVWRLRPRAEV